LRNRVSNIARRAKQTYHKKLTKDHQDDSKTFWKTFKKILPGEKKSSIIKNIQVVGKLCTNNKKIANAFNMFFTSAVTRLRQSLDLGSNARKFTHVVNHSLPDFKFKMVDESFTLNALRQLKTSKSGGLDGVSRRLLKDAAEVISKPLTQIINASLSQGIVPHE